jgi:quercetin dioxygenase-like cupin family protein
MTFTMKRLALVVGACCLLLTWMGDGRRVAAAQQRTPVSVTRMYTGGDGQTHTEQIEIKLMPRSAGGDWSEESKASGVRFLRRPPGNVEDWHPAPQRQYGITLSGHGEIEVAGGQKILLEPGGVLLIDDLTGKGHITRTVGQEDWVSVLIPVSSDQSTR